MKHDIEAAFVASELACEISRSQGDLLKKFRRPGFWTISASSSPDKDWPYADGIIVASNGSKLPDVKIALEYKRPNEGLHGVLTALGQAFAYLAKGYEATVVVIPDTYPGCSEPGERLVEFINTANKKAPVAVYTYDSRIMSSGKMAFKGKLTNKRPLKFYSDKVTKKDKAKASDTIWTHYREGSSEYDDAYKYCYELKKMEESEVEDFTAYEIPAELAAAIKRISPESDPYCYLSSSTSEKKLKNRIWRKYWFTYMFHKESMPIYKMSGENYTVNDVETLIKCSDGKTYRKFFSYSKGSIKNKLVDKLNGGVICEDKAWEEYALNIKNRAHSYRIDLEAFLYGIDFINAEGELTELGYRYVNSCVEGNPFEELPKKIFAGAYLNNGNMNVFLQFLHQVTEEILSKDEMAWAIPVKDDRGNINGYKFDSTKYREDIEDYFFRELHIIRKVSTRTGKKRPALKAELSGLAMLELVGDYRIGTGLPIDWLKVQAINDFYYANKFNELT